MRTKRHTGTAVRVLVDQPGIARTQWDAPEIDGSVMMDEAIPVGDWRGYDLVAAT